MSKASLHWTLPALTGFVYLIGVEFLAPSLIARGAGAAWLLVVSVLVLASYRLWLAGVPISARTTSARYRRERLLGRVSFILLGFTVVTYDPAVRPSLAAAHLNHLWLGFLSLFAVWCVLWPWLFMRGIASANNEDK